MVVFLSIIEVPTHSGPLPAKYNYLTHTSSSSSLAILFPGKAYPLDAPVMWYSAKAAFDAGCDVLGVEYGYQANRIDFDMDNLEYVIDEAAEALNKVLMTGKYSNVVLIGKSIGTLVQTKVLSKVSFQIRNHVFLTPLRPTIPAIREAENALVVVGDSDSSFGASDIAQITGLSGVKISIVPGADHGLETIDYRNSIDILKQVAILCGDFCREPR